MSCSGTDRSTAQHSVVNFVSQKACHLHIDDLHYVLPASEKYIYSVESFSKLPSHTFSGAASTQNFETHIRVNLLNQNQAKQWIDKIS